MRVLITGGAGFIGFSLAKRLLACPEYQITLIDNLNEYYDVQLKHDRISNLGDVTFYQVDIADTSRLEEIFNQYEIDVVVNLAAQAGVRYAKKNPESYIHSNIEGFFKLIDVAAKHSVKKFIYASSSSVYGNSKLMPFSEKDMCATPMSLYAATKLADEAIASSYFYTHKLHTIGLRFFNVYGPWGRPDMAYYKWMTALSHGKNIELRENGEMWRDMTYIDDVVESIMRLIQREIETTEPEVFNIGNRSPVKMADVLKFLADTIEVKPVIKNTPKGEEEPVKTWADTTKLKARISYEPNTKVSVGLTNFVNWYKDYNP